MRGTILENDFWGRSSGGALGPRPLFLDKNGRENFWNPCQITENVSDIGISLKTAVFKKINDRFFPYFSNEASELASFISARLKSILTIQLAARQNSGQI